MSSFILVISLLAGVLCVAAGVRQAHRQRRLARDGVPVVGHVYRLDEDRDADGSTYTPLIAFRDENGVEHRFRARLAETSIKHPVGAPVPVLHVPGRPDLADIGTRRYRLVSTLLPLAGGIVFIGAGLWGLLAG